MPNPPQGPPADNASTLISSGISAVVGTVSAGPTSSQVAPCTDRCVMQPDTANNAAVRTRGSA